MFPGQLRGPHALSPWQVKKVYSGGSTAGTGGSTTSPDCTTGFTPAADNLDPVAGVWTGYDSPYRWPAGNVQGRLAGSAKSWQQVADEGRSAYPTQSRTMDTGASQPACPKVALTESFVPFQPNTLASGAPNPLAGKDDALLYGASRQDPGGLPRGTLEHLSFSRFYDVPGVPFTATLHLRSGGGTVPAGTVALDVPPRWTTDGPKQVGPVDSRHTTTVTFTVTPPSGAPVEQNAKVAARWTAGAETGYTDGVVRLVPPAEGRFRRWGKWAEYDAWLDHTAPQARRLGRSDAAQRIGVGTTVTIPVDVHNWSDKPQSVTVSLDLPSDLDADATSKPYGPLASGSSTAVSFQVTDTDTTLPANQNVAVPVTTTSSDPQGSSTETLNLSVVPTTSVPQAAAAPVVDAKDSAGEYDGPKLDLGRIWQGASGCTGAADCGSSAGGDGSWAKVSRHDDALYFFVHVRDAYQSYAVTPRECVAHWLADSVEIMVDPRGNASDDASDTASTFKLGVFPLTNDPTNTNGNGVNGPCWERDADNHQGYATGPLADTVAGAPNAPGVQVASSAHRVGSNSTTVDRSYAGGGYDLELKVPMADLPAAVDPQHLGLNIRPTTTTTRRRPARPRSGTSTTAPGSAGRRSAACSPTRGAGAWPPCPATPRRPVARRRHLRPSSGTPTSTAWTRPRPSRSPPGTGCRSQDARLPRRVTGSRGSGTSR